MKKAILILLIVVFPLSVLADDGATVFSAKCKMCHGADGKKLAKADLSGAAVQGKTDADLVKFLTTDAKHKAKAADDAKPLVEFIRTLKK